MTDLPSDRAYIQSEETDTESPLSEQTLQKMGSAINFLNDRYQLSVEEFTSNGTFTPPEGVDTVLLIGCGGGGGGANHNGSTDYSAGSGALLGFKVVSVTPLTNYSVTIGAGGAGAGAGGGGAGSNGGNTSFGSLATFYGGSRGLAQPGALFGGQANPSGGPSQYGQRGAGKFIYNNGTTTNTLRVGPQPSAFFASNLSNLEAGGNGPFGAGGSGSGGSAGANTGGGGGADQSSAGGNGGSGRLFVIY